MTTTNNPNQHLSGLAILVADDSAITRLILNELLNFEGAKVQAVADGLEAIAAFAKSQFDVILMDIQMPKLDGAAATKKLREKGCSCPIIGITAASDAEIEQVAHLGFTDFYQKPIIASKLTDKIQDILQAA